MHLSEAIQFGLPMRRKCWSEGTFIELNIQGTIQGTVACYYIWRLTRQPKPFSPEDILSYDWEVEARKPRTVWVAIDAIPASKKYGAVIGEVYGEPSRAGLIEFREVIRE